jgi:Cys-tRNA(Pro)/Cys-tRNA(Cys) deacylase
VRDTVRVTQSDEANGEQRVTAALDASGLDYRVVRHGRVSSLAEAAAARGVEPRDVIKTIVVRRGDDDFLLVLVPGDRAIAWPKLRDLLGVNRLSMPDADTAFAATGFVRGTITPFGTAKVWPVYADERIVGREVSLGGGAHGVAVAISADEAIAALGAVVADVTSAE